MPNSTSLRPRAAILVVDDNPDNLLAVRTILDSLGQHLVESQSGDEALELAKNVEFAVILLDVHMPGTDGFETARRLRATGRPVPIICVTANDLDRAELERAYQLGAVDFLSKPLLPSAILAKVGGFVELFLLRQQSRREAQQLRLLVDGVQDYAIFMLDPQGCVATWNAGAERIKQYRADEILGVHFSRFYPQDVVDRGWPEHELRVARSEGRFEDEGWRVRKDGSQFWANVVITALHDEAGQLQGFSKITRDVTDKKRAEESARRLSEETAARRVAEENALRKDQFLATLAHELRNPLAPIRNSLQILRMPESDAATLESALQIIERQVQQLVRLVDDLLDVSRVSRGKVTLRKEREELATVVARAVEMARPIIDAERHHLVLSISAESMIVEVDLMRMTQVLGNLLTNAAKYTAPGGRIWLTAQREQECVVVQVRDTGIGLAPDMLPHVFELFVQADHAADRSQGGLGIGLTLVKSLVELHGGAVDVKSAGLGHGCEFTVRLSLAAKSADDSEASLATPAAAVEPAMPARRRIMAVDDNKDAAMTLSMLLKLKGHDVRTVHDGVAALEMAAEFRPELVFLDIGMPGMDGYEVARRMRNIPGLDRIVLAALTGWGQAEDRRRTAEAGFDHHLVKPVELNLVVKLLADLDQTRP